MSTFLLPLAHMRVSLILVQWKLGVLSHSSDFVELIVSTSTSTSLLLQLLLIVVVVGFEAWVRFRRHSKGCIVIDTKGRLTIIKIKVSHVLVILIKNLVLNTLVWSYHISVLAWPWTFTFRGVLLVRIGKGVFNLTLQRIVVIFKSVLSWIV